MVSNLNKRFYSNEPLSTDPDTTAQNKLQAAPFKIRRELKAFESLPFKGSLTHTSAIDSHETNIKAQKHSRLK